MKETVVTCPRCECDYSHHKNVEIFQRETEDSENGFHAIVSTRNIHVDKKMTRNPSERRNGIRISAWCEGCGCTFCICIVQHKGQTFITTEV